MQQHPAFLFIEVGLKARAFLGVGRRQIESGVGAGHV
jgi:hypothetical protein